jgi:hypothetical protein
MVAARRRRSPAAVRRRPSAMGNGGWWQRATVITVVVFGSSPASRFGGNRRMEVATVCRLWWAIPLYCGSARGKEEVRGCGRSRGTRGSKGEAGGGRLLQVQELTGAFLARSSRSSVAARVSCLFEKHRMRGGRWVFIGRVCAKETNESTDFTGPDRFQ